MPRAIARISWSLLCFALCVPAWAQYESDFEVEQDQRVWLRALLDARLVREDDATSSFERATRTVLSQLAIEIGATLPGDIRAHAQLSFQPDVADGAEPWLIEALLRKEWGDTGNGWGLQGGVMNLPFSMEHIGPAWSPEFTLSASALNSWLWEDASLAGLEAEWWHETSSGVRVGALVGTGFGPDRMARILALRGWTMGAAISGINTDLELPNRTDRQEIFHERDDRPALYTWVTVGDRREIASLKFGYFDNRGDQSVAGVWHTKFSVVGLELHPHSRIDVLAQYLDGTARVATPANDSSLRAYYALVSYHHNRYRVSARYDSFRTGDLDGGPDTREHGDAVTVSWQLQWKLRHRVGFEHVWAGGSGSDAWQMSYRFRY